MPWGQKRPNLAQKRDIAYVSKGVHAAVRIIFTKIEFGGKVQM